MKPSEPVTRTVLSAIEPSIGRGVSSVVTVAFSSGAIVLVQGVRGRGVWGRGARMAGVSGLALRAGEIAGRADVDPLGLDRPRRHRLTALEAGLDELGHRARPADRQPGEGPRLDGVDGGVDVEAERRLLRERGDPAAL